MARRKKKLIVDVTVGGVIHRYLLNKEAVSEFTTELKKAGFKFKTYDQREIDNAKIDSH